MISWCKGEEFEEIMKQCDIPEGDLIRNFRQTIDLLRQMRDAIKDQSLRGKLLICLDIINRDIVLATELRD
jgi:superfamily II RNA helicase